MNTVKKGLCLKSNLYKLMFVDYTYYTLHMKAAPAKVHCAVVATWSSVK